MNNHVTKDITEEADINDVFDNILLSEDRLIDAGYTEGFAKGSSEENVEAFHLGYHRGAELGAELGYYIGITESFFDSLKNDASDHSKKVLKHLVILQDMINKFPTSNSEECDILSLINDIRAVFKKEPFKMTTTQYNVIKQQMHNLLNHLEIYKLLANCHIIDYFTKDLYNTCIVDSIRNEIAEIGCEEAINILLFNKVNAKTPILTEFINKNKSNALYNCTDVCLSKGKFCEILGQWGCKNMSNLKLNIFMTPKKSHEVEIMSTVSSAVHSISQTTHLVDIGDGKGYLSSMLALHHKIPILGIDASLINTNGAVKRSQKLEKVWNGIAKNPNQSVAPKTASNRVVNNLYKQVTQFVTADTDFDELIKTVFLTDNNTLGIVGLHTCGDLGASSVKLFTKNQSVKTLLNVSCCYHLLTSECTAEKDSGFPLSAYLKQHNFQLSDTARMLSSQSLDRIFYKQELPNKRIFYRSVLEVLLKKRGVKVRVGKLRADVSSFHDYVHSALKKSHPSIVSDQEINDIYNFYKEYESELNVFYLLRCMVAPLIENIVLLDRLLFLHEQGFENSFLVQLFNPVLSPRCYALIAIK